MTDIFDNDSYELHTYLDYSHLDKYAQQILQKQFHMHFSQ